MGFCTDRSTRFLRHLGYNVVRHPVEGIKPLQLIGWKKDSPKRLGEVSQLLNGSSAPEPTIEYDQVAGNINGQKSSKLPIKIGIDLLGSVIGAMGGNLGITAKYESAKTIQFQYDNVLKDWANIISLGDYLMAGDVKWDHIVLKEYLFGRWNLYVITETVRSNKFGVTAFDKYAAELAVDLPVIDDMLGGEFSVKPESESSRMVLYEGPKHLTFGFSCVEFGAVEDRDSDTLRLGYKPVDPDQAYLAVGSDDAEEVEPTVITESGLLSFEEEGV